ncbi:hypothetical protein GXW74_06720 [Roseomonas eburnea]|uniref:Uncharacterized protein n=1 Tax=Neoroseomonas eburnea TaxID=1346889 RepID=A0A9X9X8Y7_9PROT|nr:hypothetical protein [Neoroseomonas eburnea]MBR0680173.1 hypothetical protein [Neoroseomonas eburnea]
MGEITGGSLSPWANSIAFEIEKAMNELLLADGLPSLPSDDSDATRDRRRFFCAIGRGVARHLAARRASFEIDVDESATDVFRFPALTSD